MRAQMFFLIVFLLPFLFTNCQRKQVHSPNLMLPFQEKIAMDERQQEIDEIYSLLAYALVYKDWQPSDIPRSKRRGYNIGTVLVNPKNEVVHWGLNCINSTDNATQHGEVRAIISYLDSTRIFNLQGFTMYTTLEPCVMCAGMMTMTAVKRVVYGQNDVDYSKAIERLALDSRALGGYAPYPRTVIPEASSLIYRKQLDEAYQEFLKVDEEKVLAKFLASDKAKAIFDKAYQEFLNYKVKNAANIELYKSAKSFFDMINF